MHPSEVAEAGQAYAALRFGGASQARVRQELGLEPLTASMLEAWFRRRRANGMRPLFAKHDAHVAGVLRAGGYPALRS